MKHTPIRRAPERNRDWTLDECRAVADLAHPYQPSNALYSRTPEELTDAMFGIAGNRVTKLGGVHERRIHGRYRMRANRYPLHFDCGRRSEPRPVSDDRRARNAWLALHRLRTRGVPMTAPHPAAVAFLTATPVRMFEPLEDVAFEQLPTVMRYAGDVGFRAELNAERDVNRATAHAAIDGPVRAQLKALGYI